MDESTFAAELVEEDAARDIAKAVSARHSIARKIQTGQLETVRLNLSGKQQAAIEYGADALTRGLTRFLFGREVVNAVRVAFADAPDEFPAHLVPGLFHRDALARRHP